MGSTAYVLVGGSTPVGEAIRRCEELIRSNPGDRALDAGVTRCISALVAMAGRAEEALELVERSSRVLDEFDSVATFLGKSAAAEAREFAGDRAGAMRELEAKWLKFEEIRVRPSDIRAMDAAYALALLYCNDGRWDDAERCLAYGGEAPRKPASASSSRRALPARRGLPPIAAATPKPSRSHSRLSSSLSTAACSISEHGSGRRSPRCKGRPATMRKPTLPSRARSNSTSRRETSLPLPP